MFLYHSHIFTFQGEKNTEQREEKPSDILKEPKDLLLAALGQGKDLCNIDDATGGDKGGVGVGL